MEREGSMSQIPIVGQPARVLYWYPTAAIQCLCTPDRLSIVVTTGFGNRVVCSNCGRMYHITQLRMTPDGPSVDINIETPVANPAGALQ